MKAFFYIFFVNKFLNQNGKVLEETLGGYIADAVKTTLRGLNNFEMSLPLLKSSWKASHLFFVTLSHTERVLRMA